MQNMLELVLKQRVADCLQENANADIGFTMQRQMAGGTMAETSPRFHTQTNFI